MAIVHQNTEHRSQVNHIRDFLARLAAHPAPLGRARSRRGEAGNIAQGAGPVLRPQGIAVVPSVPAATPGPAWLKDRAVQGIGLGPKIKDGLELGRPALRVYVDRKRDLAEIDNPVPTRIALGADAAIETDVIPVGSVRPQALTDRLRPIQPGCSLGHVGGSGGTLGCIVRKRDGSAARYVLSNAHVLAAAGLAQIGDEIVQPAPADGGIFGADRIGTLRAFIPFDYAQDGFPNDVDAALAEIDLPTVPFRLAIANGTLAPTRISKVLRPGMKVQMTGRSSGHAWGRIMDTNFQAIVPYLDPNNPTREIQVMFRDQVLCSRFTDSGDSGALVLSAGGMVIGLHFAGSDTVSVFNRISRVLDALDVELEV